MRDSERYALEAEQMERQAKTASSAVERDTYARLAASYRKLAQDAERFEARYGTRGGGQR